MAIDGSRYVYVTGGSLSSPVGDDYLTVKYDSSGSQFWIAYYNGQGNSDDRANFLAVDASGNICVTGTSVVSATWLYDYDYATIKYNSEGVEQLVARYNELENSMDGARTLAVDDSGNVYVTGFINLNYSDVESVNGHKQ